MAHNGGPRNCAGRNKNKCAMYRTLRKRERSHKNKERSK